MKREIKFRAWNSENMFYSHNNSKNEAVIQLSWFFDRLRDGELLMQFTGLKDKNGVDIYEGDVMGWECYEGTKHQVRWVVEYNLNQGFKTWSSTKNDEIVLGNIHENPELLKP